MNLRRFIFILQRHWSMWYLVLMVLGLRISDWRIGLCYFIALTGITLVAARSQHSFRLKNPDAPKDGYYPLLDVIVFVLILYGVILYGGNRYSIAYDISFILIYLGFYSIVEGGIEVHHTAHREFLSRQLTTGDAEYNEETWAIARSRVPWPINVFASLNYDLPETPTNLTQLFQELRTSFIIRVLLVLLTAGLGVFMMYNSAQKIGFHSWIAITVEFSIGINLVLRVMSYALFEKTMIITYILFAKRKTWDRDLKASTDRQMKRVDRMLKSRLRKFEFPIAFKRFIYKVECHWGTWYVVLMMLGSQIGNPVPACCYFIVISIITFAATRHSYVTKIQASVLSYRGKKDPITNEDCYPLLDVFILAVTSLLMIACGKTEYSIAFNIGFVLVCLGFFRWIERGFRDRRLALAKQFAKVREDYVSNEENHEKNRVQARQKIPWPINVLFKLEVEPSRSPKLQLAHYLWLFVGFPIMGLVVWQKWSQGVGWIWGGLLIYLLVFVGLFIIIPPRLRVSVIIYELINSFAFRALYSLLITGLGACLMIASICVNSSWTTGVVEFVVGFDLIWRSLGIFQTEWGGLFIELAIARDKLGEIHKGLAMEGKAYRESRSSHLEVPAVPSLPVSDLRNIHVPAALILKVLPPPVLNGLLPCLKRSPAAQQKVLLPASVVLPQLPTGKIKVSIRELVALLPAELLSSEENLTPYLSTTVELPLMEVVMHMTPELLALPIPEVREEDRN